MADKTTVIPDLFREHIAVIPGLPRDLNEKAEI